MNRKAQIFTLTTYRIYSTPDRIRNWYRVKIKRMDKRFELVQYQFHSGPKVLVLVLWPRIGLLKSNIRIIEESLKNNVDVICVINKSRGKYLQEWVLKLKEYPVTVLVRPNIGRDFGAYKAGFNYVRKNYDLSALDKLMFINDSCFYSESSKESISFLANNGSSWSSVFVNFQFHIHAQSFAMAFGPEVLQNKKFLDFWKNYYPSNERVHAIHMGEVQLSKTLLNANVGLSNMLLENSIKLKDELFEDLGIETINSMNQLNYELQGVRRFSLFKSQLHRFKFNYILTASNAAGLVGLFAFQHLGAPLKLDLVKSGMNTIGGIFAAINQSGSSFEECNEIVALLSSQGSHVSVRGIRKQWKLMGLI